MTENRWSNPERAMHFLPRLEHEITAVGGGAAVFVEFVQKNSLANRAVTAASNSSSVDHLQWF